ncbi:GNAT family N-acetyltransferase [Candidatus Saccharibacteria bacterium]|nr:GNAT family N-acetyltransferase [Candidatus Saccharibacteria bacterium]
MFNMKTGQVDLNQIPALQNIEVREDISLRPLRKSDAERILEILDADPEIRNRVTIAGKIKSRQDVINEVEKARNDKIMIRYTILSGENPIGLVSFWRDEGYVSGVPQPDDYGFGYFLDPEYRGRGIITAALERLMNVAEQNLTVRQFIAFCEDDNKASLAALQKLSFQSTNEIYPEPRFGWEERKYVRPALNQIDIVPLA